MPSPGEPAIVTGTIVEGVRYAMWARPAARNVSFVAVSGFVLSSPRRAVPSSTSQ